jgi:hypothetical protein
MTSSRPPWTGAIGICGRWVWTGDSTRLTFSDIRPGDPEAEYPRYLAGERCAPPEDCGGLPGFYGALEVLADPAHPDHADVADGFEGYDPDRIDEPVLEIALSRIARRRNAAEATWGNVDAEQ